MATKLFLCRFKTILLLGLSLFIAYAAGMHRPMSSEVGFSKLSIERIDEFALRRALFSPDRQQRLNEFFAQHGITSDLLGTPEFEIRLQTAGFTILRGLTHSNGDGSDESVVALLPEELRATIGNFVLKANASRQMLEQKVAINITRVLMSQKVASRLAIGPLSDIRVPQKFLYYLAPSGLQKMNPIKRPTWYIDQNYLVFSERIDIDETRSIVQATPAQLTQILDVIMAFGLCDLNLVGNFANCNIVFDRAGKIVFIDTPCQAEHYSQFPLTLPKHFALFNFTVGMPYESMLANLLSDRQERTLLRSWIFVLVMGLLPLYRYYKIINVDPEKAALIEPRMRECYERIEEIVSRVLRGSTIQAVWQDIQRQIPATDIEDIPYMPLKTYLHFEGIDV